MAKMRASFINMIEPQKTLFFNPSNHNPSHWQLSFGKPYNKIKMITIDNYETAFEVKY